MTSFNYKEICKTFIGIEDVDERLEYLRNKFAEYPGEFCSFMGYTKVELSTIQMRRDKAVQLMSDIALVGVSIGRNDGIKIRRPEIYLREAV